MGKGLMEEFKKFIMRGNVMDMAVGIIVGTAFTAIVNSLVKDMIMPFIGLITGGIDFTSLSLTIGDASIAYGNFIQAIISFLIIAFVVFCMIKFIGLIQRKKKEEPAEETAPEEPSEEILLLREIRDSLKK